MALDSLTGSMTMSATWTATKNLTGSAYQPISNNSTPSKKTSYGTSAANAALGGADELISFIQSIAASGSATLDFTSLTDILNATAVTLARIKGIMIRLLSPTDDSVVGTLASYVTVGNAASNGFVSQGGTGFLASATSVIDVPNGGGFQFQTSNAGGILVDATHKSLKIANADAVLAAKVEVTLFGGTT